MVGFGYACAAVLAAVFVWAAVAKATRADPTARGFAAMGVPAPTVTARAVPLAELVLAATLLAAPRPGGVAALGVLAAFSALVARSVRRGVTVGCNCFGAARVDAVPGVDLLRNGMLAGLAAAALLAARPVVPNPAAVAAAAALVAAGVLVLRAARLRRRRA
jgi:hypothetical protein